MLILGNLGLGHLFSGDLARAHEAFADQLRLRRGQTFVYGADEGLIGLGAVAAREGEPERAAELLGAARAPGYPPACDQPIDDRLERECFAHARATYDRERWRKAEAAGRLLSYDEAIAYAREEQSDASPQQPAPSPVRSTPTTGISLTRPSAAAMTSADAEMTVGSHDSDSVMPHGRVDQPIGATPEVPIC